MNAIFSLPNLANERLFDYAPGAPERADLERELVRQSKLQPELPLMIAGRDILTGDTHDFHAPHDRALKLGTAHFAAETETRQAIAAAKDATKDWSRWPWQERAAVFLRAADLLSGPWRMTLNAATMLGQSKTAHQAEIDAAAELIDFFRFNVAFMRRIYEDQPISSDGIWNRTDYRPLEGFVYAITPFNFTAIAGNLPTAPALMGNTVVWKPSLTAMLSAHYVMRLLTAAGLPDGVINLINGDPAGISRIVLDDRDLAGIHFTGSTAVFNTILSDVGARAGHYRSYPRIVGETGGKNFVLAHQSADVDALATAIVRGGYEYQGQKCSAASRIYVPVSLWPGLKDRLTAEIATIKVGTIADFSNFMGAVIDRRAFNRLEQAIAFAAGDPQSTILAGGNSRSDNGYFVDPTLIETGDAGSRLMSEELFGPVVTAYVYPDGGFDDIIRHIDDGSTYGLTGSIFADDRNAVQQALDGLRFAAGNFYINDKPTGAVVGQQPFGGSRASGTNDKAGSVLNLSRWMSPRSIKETFSPPTDHRYPFMGDG